MAGRPVGLIANPASGKDIRRLVAHASVFDNEEKRNIIRRTILGAAAAGATKFVYMPDPNYLVENAIDGLNVEASFEAVPTPHTASALDTERAAAQMCEAGCGCVISLGGDGTNRAIARGWQDVPLVAISTGTNNVFPVMLEGTVAGMAAGLVASGGVTVDEAARAAKVVHVDIEGEAGDLALIDVVLLDERFVGSRAIWQPAKLRMAMLARAEPAAIGMSAVGGLLSPVSSADDGGVFLEIGDGGRHVLAPIGPGQFAEIGVRDCRRTAAGETAEMTGPGVLALDGERERVLKPGQRAWLRVERDGPSVVDVEQTMQLGACRGIFRRETAGGTDGD